MLGLRTNSLLFMRKKFPKTEILQWHTHSKRRDRRCKMNNIKKKKEKH